MIQETFTLRGSCVALPTPFRFGAVDFHALEALWPQRHAGAPVWPTVQP